VDGFCSSPNVRHLSNRVLCPASDGVIIQSRTSSARLGRDRRTRSFFAKMFSLHAQQQRFRCRKYTPLMVWCLRCFSTATIAAFARRILFVMPRLARANTTVATNNVTLFALSTWPVPSRDRRLFAPPFHDQKFALVASAPTKCQPPLRKVSAIVPHSLVGAWQATIC